MPNIIPALQALAVPIATLHPDPANARKHNDKNLDAIKASLAKFGQRKPVVVQREGMIVRAGNGTLAAAKALGWTEVAAVVLDDDNATASQFAIADNRTAELAEWDNETLGLLLDGMDQEIRNSIGFDEADFNELMDGLVPKEATQDEVPETPADPITKPATLWVMGNHRLLCGDSTRPEDVKRLMDGKRPDLLLTDPPYNVDYEGGNGLKIANDSMPDQQFRQFLTAAFRCAFDTLKPGASFYIWHADSEGFNFRTAVVECGQKVRQCLIWAKNALVMGRQDYQWQHEPCLYGWKEGAAHGWYADRKQTTLLHFEKPKANDQHPTMKPVELFGYLIGNSTAPQGLVYDPFLGSGTSVIAAEQLGRACYGLELSPAYCDVIVKRWETLTGKKAVLADG
jgi:site-specific DNA-methyltransferase (adenine-specific)